MNQQPRTEAARRSHSGRLHGVPVVSGRPDAARVTVAWTPRCDDGAPNLAPTELELISPSEATLTTTWICPERLASNWLQTIAAARCSEVVLTARLGDDLHAKHRVLELVELLTIELAASQPLIRARFLPTESGRRRDRSPA